MILNLHNSFTAECCHIAFAMDHKIFRAPKLYNSAKPLAF